MFGEGFSAAAIAQTLEDEFLELEPEQVRLALQQAHGSLGTARTLCARLAAQQRLQAAFGGAGALAGYTGPAPRAPASVQQVAASAEAQQQEQRQQQRQWWPESEFCRPTSNGNAVTGAVAHNAGSSIGSATATSVGSSQRPRLLPHQVLPAQPGSRPPQQTMQSSPSAHRAATPAAASSSRQSPATVAPRRLAGSSPSAGSDSSSSIRQPGGMLTLGASAAAAAAAAAPTTSSREAGSAAPAPTPASGFPPVAPPARPAGLEAGPSTASAVNRTPAPAPSRGVEPLAPYYAAVFLSDKSRQQLLQHVPALHEDVSADHMTMAFRPSVAECLQMPLGKDAALFVTGAVGDHQAQALAVQHPSWVPFLSDTAPHVTVSVGEGVSAKEAGPLTEAALASRQVRPVARLKLLQGTVGVELTDGRRVFSAEELQAAMAPAAQKQRQQQPGFGSGGAPMRILSRGAPPPQPVAEPMPTESATEPAAPAALVQPPAALPGGSSGNAGGVPISSSSISSSSAVKPAAWDLDDLLDQLHLAEQAPSAGGVTAGAAAGASSSRSGSRPASASAAQQTAAQPEPLPRRGLLRLPATVAAEMVAPGREAAATPAAAPTISIRGTSRPVPPPRRAIPPPQQQQQQQQRQREQCAEPAAAEQPVRFVGKSVAEEAAEAAAGEEPLDMVSSLASLLPPSGNTATLARAGWPGAQQQQQQQQQQAAAAGSSHWEQPPLPSPAMLQGASSGGEARASGVCASSSSSSTSGAVVLGEEGGAAADLAGDLAGGTAGDLLGPVDPESMQLLQLQFPELHALVVETALRMHGGSLQAASQFLAVLDHQQQLLGVGVAGAGGQQAAQGADGRQPAQPTFGAFLQGVLPEAAAPAYDYPPTAPAFGGSGSSSSSLLMNSFTDSSYGYDSPSAAGRGGAGGRQQGFLQPQQQQRQGSAGRGRGQGGRGKAVRRSSGGGAVAGDDPMSVTERQAMNLHLSAKRLYTQAAQEAFTSGQMGLCKELQATARSHADAANAARRRANASAFRSTNASVLNTFTLDLHGQHVDEALASLERYLVTLGGLGHPGGVVLQVITGVGRHSHGNQPRVLPAVVRFLSDAGYKFDSQEDNPGCLLVQIGV